MKRFRRLRSTENIRRLVRETHIEKSSLINPVFIEEGTDIAEPVPSMPGIFRYSIDRSDELLDDINSAGIGGVLIFGIPSHKDEKGSCAYDHNGITQQAIRHIKSRYPDMMVIADVCLCEYTSHGHCGVVRDGKIINDDILLSIIAIYTIYG